MRSYVIIAIGLLIIVASLLWPTTKSATLVGDVIHFSPTGARNGSATLTLWTKSPEAWIQVFIVGEDCNYPKTQFKMKVDFVQQLRDHHIRVTGVWSPGLDGKYLNASLIEELQ